jgi:hypothetical protein
VRLSADTEALPTIVTTRCPRCGRHLRGEDLVCGMCGLLLRREERTEVAQTSATTAAVVKPVSMRPAAATPTNARPVDTTPAWEPWLYFGIGLATAPVFALTPILRFMGWFLAALVHEMGHSAVAWLCGMPSFPAISLAGHSAAVHQDQSKFLVALIACALGGAAWKFLAGHWRFVAIGIVAVVYPTIALTGVKEFFFLAGGHGTELLFATLCLWKALDGGFTESRLERALYGTVGWYLLGKNALMCIGLARSAAARAEYQSNGSFGLTNDYIRLAEDVLHWRLESVAILMLAAGILVLPAAIGFWRFTLALRRSGA